MIVRTQKAECDGDDGSCDTTLVISPDNPQPYVALLEAGWSSETAVGVIWTYCPQHRKQP